MIEVEKVQPTGLFTNYIFKAIPLAFDESMSYYECLCGLLNYMKNTMIPALNNNADAIVEIQNLQTQLQDYVDNYFDNLDVQNEINNKLDGLVADGTITNLIKEYIDPIQDEFEETVNNQIDIINNKVNAIENQTPIPVENTTEMTDTSKIYVNLTDGNWYYYDSSNEEWTIGGSYQSMVIANDSIDILKLDHYLQDTFTLNFSDFIDLGEPIGGLLKNNNGVVEVQTSSDYQYYRLSLDVNTIYDFNYYNIAAMCGLLIVDGSDNILFDGNTTISSSATWHTTVMKINQNGLYALMGDRTRTVNDYKETYLPAVRSLSKITNTLNYDLTPKLLQTFTNKYAGFNTNNGRISLYDNANSTAKVYFLNKGITYNFNTFSYQSIKGLYIYNENFEKLYEPETSQTILMISYSYTPTSNCFAFTTDFITNQNVELKTTVSATVGLIEELKSTNNVGFNKWVAIGDSITAKTYRANKNYIDYIKEDLPFLTINNLGVSGSGYLNGSNTFIDRLDSINSYDLNNDIITVMGSINDISYVEENLGELGDTLPNTVYGALYTFFYTLFTKFNGVRVGCISPIIAKTYYNHKDNWDLYFKALKETCELFNVPFLDLLHNTNLRPNNTTFINTYYLADGEGNEQQVDTNGVHPNSLGYKLFYNQIKEFIKTL